MAMTNTERQRKFREQKKKAGLKRSDSWTDRAGLLAPATEKGTWAMMELKDLGKEIKKMFSEYEDWEREVVYAELFEYAKRVEGKLKKVFAAGREAEKA